MGSRDLKLALLGENRGNFLAGGVFLITETDIQGGESNGGKVISGVSVWGISGTNSQKRGIILRERRSRTGVFELPAGKRCPESSLRMTP